MFCYREMAMLFASLLLSALLSACAPAPGETAMSTVRSPFPTAQAPSLSREGAAQGPIPEPVSAAGVSVPTPRRDSAAEAEGRRTLSTAFVRVGPDGLLTVELRDGRVIHLQGVTVGRDEYCGMLHPRGSGKARFCGRYDQIAAARPGGPN